MNNFQLTQTPCAKAEMLIRRPVAEVFEAFINPATISNMAFCNVFPSRGLPKYVKHHVTNSRDGVPKFFHS